ncbi:MAG: aconitate hydratase, partial [Candidatus Eremiobacteraeota bacterium]|nr:aconitate hydratase [Candidatus Eremiobacteraeota bacterium]
LLGVRAVIAESFERIHRSNLIGMGILPLEFLDGADRTTYALTGEEIFDILGLEEQGVSHRMTLYVKATDAEGKSLTFKVLLRIDTPDEAEYYRNGGILQYVLRQLKAS